MTNTTVKERARKPKSVNSAKSLIDALKTVSLSQKKNEHDFQSYVLLNNKRLTSCDGSLFIDTPIQEDISACVNYSQLLKALSKCGQQFSLTVLDNQVCVCSGEFTAYVQCISIESIPYLPNQVVNVEVDEVLQEAFRNVVDLSKDGSQHVITSSILMTANTVIGANTEMIKEYWHGFNFPTMVTIPTSAAKIVATIKKPLIGIGCDGQHMTFFFKDSTVIRTELYDENWYGQVSVLNNESNAFPLPPNFWQAVNSMVDVGNGNIQFSEKGISTESKDATFNIEIVNANANLVFNGKLLKTLNGNIDRMDIQKDSKMMFFFGDKIRGILNGKDITNEFVKS